jgi:hypothetical protein
VTYDNPAIRSLLGIAWATAGVLLSLCLWGCSSGGVKSSRLALAPKEHASQPVASKQDSTNPGIDLNCVMDRIQNPPEAFHYSYRKNGSNNLVEEADITPQSISGSFNNNGFSHAFQAVRSDQQSWHDAWGGLMGIVGMSSSVALVNHSSAMVREGTEKMNGFDTIRYSIDTARGGPEELGLYKTTLGDGGFERGTAWVTQQGCPVKVILDSELHSKGGGVAKSHFEEAMVRK